jgi:hypothetical protein
MLGKEFELSIIGRIAVVLIEIIGKYVWMIDHIDSTYYCPRHKELMLQASGFRLHVAWSLQLAAKTLDVYAALSNTNPAIPFLV